LLLLAGLALAGCKTIHEELPSAPSDSGAPVVNVPLPVTVTPLPNPTPETPAPTPSPGNPSPPPPDENDDSDEFIPDNTNPVAKVTAKVFFVECGGEVVPGSEYATSAPVGCRVHLDTTPKDASGKPTQPKNDPRWNYSDRSSFTVGGSNPFTPVLTVKAPGSTSIYSVIDGVQSNVFSISFK
jgi:hypothetical protein